jgi:hypothetical protein
VGIHVLNQTNYENPSGAFSNGPFLWAVASAFQHRIIQIGACTRLVARPGHFMPD